MNDQGCGHDDGRAELQSRFSLAILLAFLLAFSLQSKGKFLHKRASAGCCRSQSFRGAHLDGVHVKESCGGC
jgi:hypothetical protein